MTPNQKIAKILGITEKTLENFEFSLRESTGKTGIIENLCKENEKIIEETIIKLNTGDDRSADHTRGTLQKIIFQHEKQFLEFLNTVEGKNEFEKAANLSKTLVNVGKGFFLKKDFIKQIFLKRKSENLLGYLGYQTVEEIFANEDLLEAFSALRFVENNEWMHKTFEEVYSSFTEVDFEERAIEIKVLNTKWHDIAKKFVEKKHHNVSHLKEFGVIFLNPITMDVPGKFLRDFALLLHHFHEIEFYSKLFKKYSAEENFAEKFKSLLRGDVKETIDIKEKNTWLIVQR